MQLPNFSNQLNLSNLSEYIGNSSLLLPVASLFLVRFVLPIFFRGGLGLLAILAAVFLICSSDPKLSSDLAGFVNFSDSAQPYSGLTANPWLMAGLFVLILYMFRHILFNPLTLLILSFIAYMLFFRDFRPAAIAAEGNWKTSLVGAGILLAGIFIYSRLNRRRFGYAGQPFNMQWLQPVLLVLALGFTALIIKNPVWLEAHLPGWKNSIGLGVLAASLVAFFYTLPLKLRPYALSACWLFVVVVLARTMRFF